MSAWHDDARTIPLWPSAERLRVCPPMARLSAEQRAAIVDAFEARDDAGLVNCGVGECGECFDVPDLNDPDTYRSAVARLALRLGATADAEGAA